jgi:hypothetical protein
MLPGRMVAVQINAGNTLLITSPPLVIPGLIKEDERRAPKEGGRIEKAGLMCEIVL